MSWQVWLLALALMLVLEGLMPLLSPARWRALFLQILGLQDGQIRFYGACMVLLGLALVWWLDAS